jgi:hypothetical protein
VISSSFVATRICYLSASNDALVANRSDKKRRLRPSGVAEKLALIGVMPEVLALDPGDQVTWFSNAGNLKIEFDPQRCPFASNVFQAPTGVRLSSGPPRPGLNPGSYKYRLSVNDVVIAHPEILLRGK